MSTMPNKPAKNNLAVVPKAAHTPPVRELPDAAEMARHAAAATELLKALAHPARLLVMCRLVDGEASVGELQQQVGLSMSALSQHLAVLRELALVSTRRQAQTIFYSLADGPALGVMQALYDAYCAPEK
jgi:ArsR family transcriptional regulator, virulence genes transcriptional regulator